MARWRGRAEWRVRSAFTLVELLVVVGIITLLVMIMAPFLANVKESAYNALCQNNLEKLGQAIWSHSVDSGATLPDAEGWSAAASGGGGKPVMFCPKGRYKASGTGSVATKPHVKMLEHPPVSVIFNDLEDNKIIFGFKERNNFILPSAVTVDLSEPGRYNQFKGNNSQATTKTIPAGTKVNCFYMHFDSIGRTGTTSQGAVSFGADIIGVIVNTSTLDASDGTLGSPGTTYETGRKARGFENGAEIVILEPDMRTFTIERFKISYPGEEVRILTMPGGGGGSYAMNVEVNPKSPRQGQLLLLEYNKSLADVDGYGYNDDLEVELAPRHFGRLNVLLVNGSVQAKWPGDLKRSKDIWRHVLPKNRKK